MTKIVDIQQSISAANGNTALAKDLFIMLLDDLGARSQQIKDSFQNNDMDTLAEHIHKLYGATAYCVVPALRESVGSLDIKLKEKNYNVGQLVNTVLNEIQNIIKDGPNILEEDWNCSS
jgi:two-component system sensor histidine kinase BarA